MLISQWRIMSKVFAIFNYSFQLPIIVNCSNLRNLHAPGAWHNNELVVTRNKAALIAFCGCKARHWRWPSANYETLLIVVHVVRVTMPSEGFVTVVPVEKKPGLKTAGWSSRDQSPCTARLRLVIQNIVPTYVVMLVTMNDTHCVLFTSNESWYQSFSIGV